MSLNISSNDRLKNTFISELEGVSLSIKASSILFTSTNKKSPHTYLAFKAGHFPKGVQHKSEACSFRKILFGIEDLINNGNLKEKQITSLKDSLEILNGAFESKKASFLYKLPITSCLFENSKKKLVRKGKSLIAKLESQQLPFIFDQFGGNKRKAKNESEAIEKLKSEKAGNYYVWIIPEKNKIGMLIKPPLAPLTAKDTILIDPSTLNGSMNFDTIAKEKMINYLTAKGMFSKVDPDLSGKPLGFYCLKPRNDPNEYDVFMVTPGWKKNKVHNFVVTDPKPSFSLIEDLKEPLWQLRNLEPWGLYLDTIDVSDVEKRILFYPGNYLVFKHETNPKLLKIYQAFEDIRHEYKHRIAELDYGDDLYQQIEKFLDETNKYHEIFLKEPQGSDLKERQEKCLKAKENFINKLSELNLDSKNTSFEKIFNYLTAAIPTLDIKIKESLEDALRRLSYNLNLEINSENCKSLDEFLAL